MTLEIFKALAWEHLRRTRWPFLISVGFSLVVCIVTYLAILIEPIDSLPAAASYADGVIISFGWGHMILIGVLLFAFCKTDDLTLTVPEHHQILPISATAYVLCRLTFLFATLALSLVIAEQMFYLFFPPEMIAEFPSEDFVLGWTLFFAFLQTLAWLAGARGFYLTFAVLFIVILFDDYFRDLDMTAYENPIIAACFFTSYAVSIAAVALHRRGRLDFLDNMSDVFPFLSPGRKRDARPFASPRAAMLWFEWRRQTRQVPVNAVWLTIFYLAIFGWMDQGGFFRNAQVEADVNAAEFDALVVYGDWGILSTFIGVACAILIASGMFFFRNYRMQTSSMRMFLFTRPVETRDMAAARMISVLRCVGVTLIPLALIAAVVFMIDYQSTTLSTYRPMINRFTEFELVFLALGALIGYAAAMWAALWLGNIALAVAVIGIFSGPLWCLNYFFDLPSWNGFLPVEFAVTVLVATAIAIGILLVAHRRKLMIPAYLKVALLLTPIIAISSLIQWSSDSLGNLGRFDYSFLTFMVPLIVILAILPIATVPLAMQWTRHR